VRFFPDGLGRRSLWNYLLLEVVVRGLSAHWLVLIAADEGYEFDIGSEPRLLHVLFCMACIFRSCRRGVSLQRDKRSDFTWFLRVCEGHQIFHRCGEYSVAWLSDGLLTLGVVKQQCCMCLVARSLLGLASGVRKVGKRTSLSVA
jgi:hypothetical protein